MVQNIIEVPSDQNYLLWNYEMTRPLVYFTQILIILLKLGYKPRFPGDGGGGEIDICFFHSWVKTYLF
jgi:hypothetical protein